MLNKRIGPNHNLGRHMVRRVGVCGDNQRGEWQRIARVSMVAALLVGGLAGCGGSDDGGSSSDGSTPPSSTPPVSQLSVVDGFKAVHPGVTTRVDLSAFVRGTGVMLSAMSSEQEGCNATNLSGLSADVTSDSGLCEFTYKVSSEGGEASATLNTLASDKASPVIPPVSQTMTLAEPTKAFDLVALLGADWPAGYNLDPASVVVQGGSAQGTATASGNVVTYTHPGEAVWNRIIFTLKDPAKPTEDVFGALYVTVSDSANQPPTINPPKYDYAQAGGQVKIHAPVTLDLSNLPGLAIADPDSADWQLVEVQSYSASVAPVDPNSVTNRQFTFEAGTVGEHIVSYIVGDHEAGFAMGLIKVDVGPDEVAKSWNNIAIGPATYLATPLYSEVAAVGVVSEAAWDAGVGNTIGAVEPPAAGAFCKAFGAHMATKDEVDTLFATTAVDPERAKYPVGRNYLLNDAGTIRTVNLQDGTMGDYVAGNSEYVLCVSSATVSYIPNTANLVYGVNTDINANGWRHLGIVSSDGGVGSITVTSSNPLGSGTLDASNISLNPSHCLATCKLQITGDISEYGTINIRITNKVNQGAFIDIGPLTLLQDARVKGDGVRMGTNNSLADGTSTNTVLVAVETARGEPRYDAEMKLNYEVTPNGNVTTTPSGGSTVTTDANGDVTLSQTATVAGDYAVNLAGDAVVGGLPRRGYDCVAGEIAVKGVGCFRNPDGVGQTWGSADAYCRAQGYGYYVPLVTQLSQLHALYPSNQMNTVHGWPTDAPYWAQDLNNDGGHYSVNMNDGNVYSHNATGQLRYISCIR